jgi:hypothetical protein
MYAIEYLWEGVEGIPCERNDKSDGKGRAGKKVN